VFPLPHKLDLQSRTTFRDAMLNQLIGKRPMSLRDFRETVDTRDVIRRHARLVSDAVGQWREDRYAAGWKSV
jgi:hypothetical protein